MAMTNDIGVHSLLTTAPPGANKQVEQTRAAEAAKSRPDAPSGRVRDASSQPGKQADKGALAQTVEDLNGLVQDLQRQVRFSLDDKSGEMVVTVVDGQTDDVIRQIPAEDVLQLRERLAQATGAIFKGRA